MNQLPPDARAIAELRAAEDRETLARFRRDGAAVRREGAYEARHRRLTGSFVDDIEGRAFPKRRVNLAIRPKAKKGRRR